MFLKTDSSQQDQNFELDTAGLEGLIPHLYAGNKESAAVTNGGEEESHVAVLHTGPTSGQWHLESVSGYDINVLTAWQDYTGEGVLVGVVDSGVEYTHSELAANYDTNLDWDYIANNNNGGPKFASDNHGTAVAGNIAAANDGSGNTGVAYDATITSFRLIAEGVGVSTTQVNGALTQDVDVSNNSWGWGTGLVASQAFNQAIDNSLLTAVSQNRGGLGTVLVFSAGNDREDGDNSNYSELTNSRFTITVAAGNEDGTIAYFSTPGADTLITAPGTSIYTTDRAGNAGYSTGNYTTVQGTSFSAPITSGVVALMLEANPNLGYRDVQEILAYSAVQTDTGNASWEFNGAHNWNGGGLHVSEDFGMGFIDATAAVRLSETWFAIDSTASVYSNEGSLTFNSGTLNAAFDNNTYANVLHVDSGFNIDYVELQLNMTQARVSDLTIELISPDGTSSIMFDQPPAAYTENDAWQSWRTFTSTQHWGETALGNWTLSITDHVSGQSTTLTDWTLKFYGDTASSNNTYIYTNEFDNFTGDATRQTLIDTDGGNDTINAAAVSTDLLINLAAGASNTIAGNDLTIGNTSEIENAIGGDGNDVILGNGVGNTLIGGRGNDTLDGSGGIDTLIGGRGDDIYYVDSLNDVVVEYANEGYDIINSTLANYVLSANVELLQFISGGANVTGSINADTIYGNAGANNIWGVNGNDILYGLAGNDMLGGGAGADILIAGDGNDTIYGGDGNDNIRAGNDNDILYGGAGIDDIRGEDGDDVLHGGGDNDYLVGGTGNDTLNGDDGNDQLWAQDGDDILYGGAGNDIMEGGTGADALYGGAGDDFYRVDNLGDAVIEGANEGNDSVYTLVDFTLDENVENLVLMGSANLNGTGNDLGNNITGTAGDNILTGNGGNDNLNAGLGNDTLYGGDGNDFLQGGGNVDTMYAGNGNDTYQVDNVLDVVVENANEGTDTVQSTVHYTLTSDVENLTLIGTGINLNGTGNALNNNITGTSGNNTLNGGDGNDYISGGAGNDNLIGGNGNDTLYGGTGNDYMTDISGNDVYFRLQAGFGDDIINDSAGVDLVDFSSFNLAEATGWTAIDSNGDNGLDRLLIDFNTGDSLLIAYYFNNANIDPALCGAGAGYIEEIRFADTSLDLADVQGLVA